MTERYTRIKELTFPEQTAACPVTLDKGALLLDNEQGRCILQLKLLNRDTKPVKTVQVTIACLGDTGQTIRTVKHSYTAKAGPGAYFGSDQAIDLGGADVKDARVTVEKKTRLWDLWLVRFGIPLTALVFLLTIFVRTFSVGNLGNLLYTVVQTISGIPALAYSAFVPLCIGIAVYFALKENGQLQKLFGICLYAIAAFFAYSAVGEIFSFSVSLTTGNRYYNVPLGIVLFIVRLIKATAYLLLAIPKARNKLINNIRTNIHTNNLLWAIGVAAVIALVINF